MSQHSGNNAPVVPFIAAEESVQRRSRGNCDVDCAHSCCALHLGCHADVAAEASDVSIRRPVL